MKTEGRVPKKTIANLQVLRGVAALMVVVHHSTIQIPAFDLMVEQRFGKTDFWARGVDLFFVISGFVIYLSIRKSAVGIRQFLLSRLIRVAPLYWLFTLTLVMLVMLAPTQFRTTIVSFPSLAKSLLFIPYYNDANPIHVWPLLVPGWSLNYEMFFYAMCAVGMWRWRDRLLSFLTIVFVSLVAIGLWKAPDVAIVRTYTDSRLLLFLFGALLSGRYVAGALDKRPWLKAALPIGIGLFSFGSFVPLWAFFWWLPSLSGCICIVAGLLALEPDRPSTQYYWALLLGDASYSIYLSHLFTLGALRVLWARLELPTVGLEDLAVYILSALVASSLVGLIVHRYVEQPLLRSMQSEKVDPALSLKPL